MTIHPHPDHRPTPLAFIYAVFVLGSLGAFGLLLGWALIVAGAR